MIRALALLAAATLALVVPTAAAEFEVARVIAPVGVALPSGTLRQVKFDVIVKPGYHVQANPAAYPNLIPIVLSLTPASGVAVGKPVYPKPKRLRLEGSGDQLLVYDGHFQIIVPMARLPNAPPSVQVEGSLHYQGCDHVRCLFPRKVPVVLTLDAPTD